MTGHTPHPALAPVLTSLAALRAYQPTGAADLAEVLKDLHGYAIPNVIDAIVDVLWNLADWARSETGTDTLGPESGANVAEHLCEAAAELMGTGAAHLDRARAATGHYDGTATTGGTPR
jgi:hypothetical protein